jgi:hypothetical protein
MNHVPPNWSQCPSLGNAVGKTNLIPFKSPSSSIFTPAVLISSLANRSQHLGLVIDLSPPEYKLYNPEEFKSNGIKYVRLPMDISSSDLTFTTGPSKNSRLIDTFCKIVSGCVDDFQKSNHYIGVHCDLGFRATGLMICSYLICENNCGLGAALQLFAQSRAPGIFDLEVFNYLRRLDASLGGGFDLTIYNI